MDTQVKRTLKLGIRVGLSLGAIVGLVGCGEQTDEIEGTHEAAISGLNGLTGFNGLAGLNGLSGSNGLTGLNGLAGLNGLSAANGLSSLNGLSSMNGYMTTDGGRRTVSYIVRCALAANDTLVKADQNGVNYTFAGGIGLCPQWKIGGIATDRACQNQLSACLMAHVNTAGVHIPLWLDSSTSAIGWGIDLTNYPFQEGTFFGNIMMTGDLSSINMTGVSGPAAWFCDGNGFLNGNAGVVAGRLGKGQSGKPYMNPFGDGTLCNNKGAGYYSKGTGGQPAPDGFQQMCTSNYCFQNGDPITVWRNNSYKPVFDGGYAYRMMPMHALDKSVDVAGGSTSNGTAVQQYSSWETAGQKFNVLASGSNWKIAMSGNTAKCVGPRGNGTVNSTVMEIQDCNGTTAQAWTVTADEKMSGSFQFKNVASGRCLDVSGASTSNTALMQLYDCKSYYTANQRFKVQAY